MAVDHAVVQIVDLRPGFQVTEQLPQVDNAADHEPDRGNDADEAVLFSVMPGNPMYFSWD